MDISNNHSDLQEPHHPSKGQHPGPWMVVVEWTEPESFTCLMGPYKTYNEAWYACTHSCDWLEQFATEYTDDDKPVVTDDVRFTIVCVGVGFPANYERIYS